jgi:hypothetical protein
LIQEQGQTRNLDSKIYLPAIVSNSNSTASLQRLFGLIGRRNTLCYGRPAAELPRNDADVPNLQQSEIIQPAGRNGRCLPFVSWGLGYAVLIGIGP